MVRDHEDARRETRARIAGVALDLFSALGYDAVSVAQIAATCGVTERTVFNHFRSKFEILFDEADDLLSELLHSVAHRTQGQSALAAAGDFVAGLAEWTETRRPPRVSPMVAPLIVGSGTLRDGVAVMFDRWERTVAEQLRDEGATPEVAFVTAAAIITELRGGFRGMDVDRVHALLRDGLEGHHEEVS